MLDKDLELTSKARIQLPVVKQAKLKRTNFILQVNVKTNNASAGVFRAVFITNRNTISQAVYLNLFYFRRK